ncbi:HNH endonuclease signature motif containing protein [Steroidobacter sp.]|uniref:HNH endonuclease signature motif containing protein n=1 Tax=Steroidobacter sp. TaxID=1978227 RepID=UPI001A5FE981|nr:HNH endonuclease signature motif containing protein [Steroidobacter sp.]MBL8265507.1 DUF222 domain-containing protein [Steroidobacter sp.]
MQISIADDQAIRSARIAETRALGDQITELAGHINAGTYRFLSLVAEFDRRSGWNDGSTQSCAHWLNWKCGISFCAAREKVRTARALENLPKISAAMERGEISYSKVREISRVACPATEDYFLMIATHGTAQHVEQLVRYYRHAKESEELTREEQQQQNRTLQYFYDHDGSLVVKARLPAQVGALFKKAIDKAVEDLWETEPEAVESDTPAGTPTVKFLPTRTKRADALELLAESFLQNGAANLSSGDKYQIVVHVDAEALQTGCAGRCEIEDGTHIATETARRLSCDSSVVAIIEDEHGEPLNVGRKTRSIPPALQRALRSRDKGCRFPGCCNTRYTDAHHIHHWAHGGETKLSNLVTLCRFHHRSVHEGKVQIYILDDGAIRFLQPNGKTFDSVAPNHNHPVGDWRELPRQHEQEGIVISSRTAVTRWDGGPMDFGMAVASLLRRTRAAANPPRGESSATKQ